MELIRYEEKGEIFIQPEKQEDKALFIHCANGLCAVKEGYFYQEVQGVLHAHGQSRLAIVDMTDNNAMKLDAESGVCPECGGLMVGDACENWIGCGYTRH